MGFLSGLIIGLFVGCFVGIFIMVIVTANGRIESDDYEQKKHCRNSNKKNTKDRNEF